MEWILDENDMNRGKVLFRIQRLHRQLLPMLFVFLLGTSLSAQFGQIITPQITNHDVVNCDFFANENISFSAQNGFLNPLTDSILYIFTDQDALIIGINESPLFPSPNISASYSIHSLVFQKIAFVNNLSVGNKITDVVVLGCHDWSDPLDIQVCNCVADSIIVNDNFCYNESYSFGDTILTDGGIFERQFINRNGCDSVVTLNLVKVDKDTLYIIDRICEGESILFGGSLISDGGIYLRDAIDVFGCNQIEKLDLTIAPHVNVVMTTDFVSCAFAVNQQFSLGTDFQNQSSGDSTLYILTEADGTIVIVKDIPTFTIGSSGNYQIFALTFNYDVDISPIHMTSNIQDLILCGCADISTGYGIEICGTCHNVSQSIQVGICFGDSYLFDNQLLTSSGIYFDTIAIGDCDSIVMLNLFHHNQDTIRLFETICTGDSTLFDGAYIKIQGTYLKNRIDNNTGCNQTTILELSLNESITINPASQYITCAYEVGENISLSILPGDHNPNDEIKYILAKETGEIVAIEDVPNFTILPAGNYQAFALVYEADALILGLALGINIGDMSICGCADISDGYGIEVCDMSCQDTENSISVGICFGDDYVFGNQTLNIPGTYLDTVTIGDCDSIITLSLFHRNQDTIRLFETICQGDSILYNGEYRKDAGLYIHVDEDPIFGCDQVATLGLMVENGLLITPATDFLMCAYEPDEVILLNINPGNVNPGDITKYIWTTESGEILAIENTPTFSTPLAGNFQAFALVYELDANVIGLSIGENINEISICGCADISNGFGIKVCNPLCDTTYTDLSVTICLGDTYTNGNSFFTESGNYEISFFSEDGCDSIVRVDLIVVGAYISVDIPTSFDICTYFIEDEIFLSQSGGVTSSIDNTIYLLTDELGIVLFISHVAEFQNPGVGNYIVYALSFHENEQIKNLNIGSRIDSLITCTCADIGEPFAFEICDALCDEKTTNLNESICLGESFSFAGRVIVNEGIYRDTLTTSEGCDSVVILSLFVTGGYINATLPSSFDSCATDVNTPIVLSESGGIIDPDITTLYLRTNEDGYIESIKNRSEYFGLDIGNYAVYALSFYNDYPPSNLELFVRIDSLIGCDCADLSQPYAFEVCEEAEYDLALKYYLEGPPSYNLYNDIPATIKIHNQGNGTISSFDLAAYMPQGLTLSENDPFWSLSTDSMAVRTIHQSIVPGDSLSFQILLRSTGVAYDLYLLNTIATAEITAMRDTRGNIVDDIDSRPDNNRTNDNGSYETTDNFCDDDGTIDEDDHDFIKILFDYIDPTGYIYCEKTGELITGGTIQVSGPENVRILKDGSDGQYQYLADSTGLYILTITHPLGYPLSITCNVSSDTFYVADQEGNPAIDRDGLVNDTVVTGSHVVNGQLVDNTCAGNSFYDHLYFDADGPAMLINNNIPVQCIGAVTIKCDGTGENPFVDVLDSIKVELFNCTDTLTPLETTYTFGGGGFAFENITAIGCYKVRLHQTADFMIEANNEIDEMGWSREIVIDWGSCDSILFACFAQCGLIPIVINDGSNVDTCGFEAGLPIDLSDQFANVGQRDTTLFILTDSLGKIIEIIDVPLFNSQVIGSYFAYALDLKGLRNIQGLVVDSLVQNVSSCPQDSLLTYGPFSINVCGYFDLALRKTLSLGTSGPFKAFDEVPFMITVYNQGRIGARDIDIYDHFPKGMILSPNDHLWTSIDDSTAVYTIPNLLEPGDSVKVEILTKLTPYIAKTKLKSLINIAEIASAKDSLGQDIEDIDSTPDAIVDNDNGGNVDDDTNDEVNDDGTMDEDDSDPELVNIDDLDPQGFIYCDKTGEIITGGLITVTGPGNINMISDGSDGSYQFFVDLAGEYTITYTHPTGFPMSPSCSQFDGVFDPTGKDGLLGMDKDGIVNNVLVMGSDTSAGYLINSSCGYNTFFTKIQIDPNDPPLIANNNIPVSCIVIASIVCQVDDLSGSIDGDETGLSAIEVSLYKCDDIQNSIEVTYTNNDGIYSFPSIDEPGCYRVRFTETEDFQVIPNDVVDDDGWSVDVIVDWGDCDSTISVCFTVCDLNLPIAQTDEIFICSDQDLAELSVTVGSGLTADWYDEPNGGFLLASNTTIFIPPDTGTYYVASKFVGSTCTSASRTPIALKRYAPLSVVTINSSALCNSTFGNIEVRIFGSSSTYDIQWYRDGGDTSSINNVTTPYILDRTLKGDWNIIVTDQNGCTATAQAVINAPEPLTCDVMTIGNISCPGQDDGTTTAVAIGGTAPYTFTLFDQSNTTGTFSNLSPGTYGIIVEDNNFCTNLCVFTITEPDTLKCIMTIDKNPECNSGIGGNITVSSIGGTGIKRYILQGDTNSTGVFTNIQAGSFFVEVLDQSGCTSECAFTLFNTDTDLGCNISVTKSLSCTGATDAQILVNATGSTTGLFSFTLGDSTNTTGIFKGLSSGIHSVTISDGKGCFSFCSIDIADPDDFSCDIVLLTASSCANLNGASFKVNTNRTGNLSYILNNSPAQKSDTFRNIVPGNHAIRVIDDNGCETECVFNIAEPQDMFCIIGSINNITCQGGRNGMFVVRPFQGTTPFLYSDNGGPFESRDTFSNLKAGLHTIRVKDANGCQSECSITLTESQPLTCAAITLAVPVCPNAPTGSMVVRAVGGTAPYQYKINDRAFTTDTLFSNLRGGIYNIETIDNNGCISQCFHTISDPEEITCSVVSMIPASCPGVPNGTIEIVAIGGTSPYNYQIANQINTHGLFSSMASGIIGIIVTDQNDCTSLCVVEITSAVAERPQLRCNNEGLDLGCNPTFILTGEDIINEGYINVDDNSSAIRLISETLITQQCITFKKYNFIATNQCDIDSDTCSYTVMWKTDTVPPLLPVIEAVINANCVVPIGEPITVLDDCGQSITALPDDEYNNDICENKYIVTRSWTFNDSCGNTSVLTQIINVNDNAVPIIIGASDDTTVYAEADIPPVANLSATDNCGRVELAYVERRQELECGYKLVRQWSASDPCGNTTIRVQNIRVEACDTIVIPKPDTIDLELTKMVSNTTPFYGDRIEYSLTLTNKGPDNATGIEVIDYLPNGLIKIKSISHGGVLDNRDIFWQGLSVPVDSVIVLTYTAEVLEPLSSVSYKNVAEITKSEQVDIDSPHGNDDGDQSEDDEDSMVIIPKDDGGSPGDDEIDLELSKTVSDTTPNIRDIVTYTIVVKNNGDTIATGVDVVDYLPVDYCVNFTNISHGGMRVGDKLIWENLILEPGMEIILTFNATISGKALNQAIINVAEIVSQDQDDLDSTPNNNDINEDDQDEVTLFVGSFSDLSLEKNISNPTAQVNDTVTFEIVLRNAGPDILDFAEIEDLLPDGYGHIHNVSDGGIYYNDRVQWIALGLEPNDSLIFSFDARVIHFENETCDYRNTAQVMRSSNGDPDSTPGNDDGDQSEDDEDSAQPDFSLQNEADSVCVELEVAVLMEGPYIFEKGIMRTDLNRLGYLPGQIPITFFGIGTHSGQPYYHAPWLYNGDEGKLLDAALPEMDNFADYPTDVVDYVHISIRSDQSPDTEMCERSGMVHENGEVTFFEDIDCCYLNPDSSYYLIIQHRNHLLIMSHEKQPLINGIITYDFRTQNSYRGPLGSGQKEVDIGRWAMFAANGDQTLSSSSVSDINIKDMGMWLRDDGRNSSYYFRDFDLNGDVNVQDKGLFLRNNGVFSDVRKGN